MKRVCGLIALTIILVLAFGIAAHAGKVIQSLTVLVGTDGTVKAVCVVKAEPGQTVRTQIAFDSVAAKRGAYICRAGSKAKTCRHMSRRHYNSNRKGVVTVTSNGESAQRSFHVKVK